MDLSPRGSTAIAMRAETVHLTLYEDRATVVATFWLENTGTEPEALEVGFPTEARPLRTKTVVDAGLDPFFSGGNIYAFVAKVDGEEVKTVAARDDVTEPAQHREHSEWVCWPMSFAAGQKRTVDVTYEVETRDSHYLKASPLQAREVEYVLRTGRGWKGTIGTAKVTVTMADGMTFDHVESAFPRPETRGPKAWEWTWQDFEPELNVTVRYHVYRDATDAIARIQPRLEKEPNNGDLWFDWAENHETLGNHAEAAATYARLAKASSHAYWLKKTIPRRSTYMGVPRMPLAYRVARSFHAAGDAAQADGWRADATAQAQAEISAIEAYVIKNRELHESSWARLGALRLMLDEMRSWSK